MLSAQFSRHRKTSLVLLGLAGLLSLLCPRASSAATPPTLLSPADGSYISTSTPVITWSTNTAGDHRAQISSDSGFASVLLDSTTANTYVVSTATLVSATTYWWRVAPTATTDWSVTRSFVIDLASPSFSAPQVSSGPTGAWTNLPMTTYLSTNIVSARITVTDPVAGLLVSTGLPTGLVGQWHADESSGSVALDASINGNNGTLTGANGLPTWTTGKRGSALNFDGVDDYVSMGTNFSANTASLPITISAWVKNNSNDPVNGNEYVNINQMYLTSVYPQ